MSTPSVPFNRFTRTYKVWEQHISQAKTYTSTRFLFWTLFLIAYLVKNNVFYPVGHLIALALDSPRLTFSEPQTQEYGHLRVSFTPNHQEMYTFKMLNYESWMTLFLFFYYVKHIQIHLTHFFGERALRGKTSAFYLICSFWRWNKKKSFSFCMKDSCAVLCECHKAFNGIIVDLY